MSSTESGADIFLEHCVRSVHMLVCVWGCVGKWSRDECTQHVWLSACDKHQIDRWLLHTTQDNSREVSSPEPLSNTINRTKSMSRGWSFAFLRDMEKKCPHWPQLYLPTQTKIFVWHIFESSFSSTVMKLVKVVSLWHQRKQLYQVILYKTVVSVYSFLKQFLILWVVLHYISPCISQVSSEEPTQ